MKKYIVLLLVAYFFSGCAKKVGISYLVPAKADRASKTKKVSVLGAKNDRIGLATKLESALASKVVQKKPYFTVVSRSDRDKIIKEQKFQYSGLVDENAVVAIGDMIGAQAMITASIDDASASQSSYYETRVRCIDKKCKKLQEYNVSCIKVKYNLSTNIKMTDVQRGDIIYADTFTNSSEHSKCSDSSRAIPSKSSELSSLADVIVNRFVSDISPSVATLSVEILDDPEVDYNDRQEELLKYGIEYIQMGRIKKAETLIGELVDTTEGRCYVANYNLGVIKELQGEYNSALELYTQADKLLLKPNKSINIALNRIKLAISNREQAQKQINK
jgi:tetratricopeptide (TPR) repeat protein